MKRKILIQAIIMASVCGIMQANASSDDSTKVIDSGNKRIIVTENTNKQRVEVEVYELSDGNTTDAYEKIFEGHYRDGKVNEQRRSLISIDIPTPLSKFDSWRLNRKFEPHYTGFGMGFAGFADRGAIDDIPLRSGKSFEINLNLLQNAFPISSRYKWAIVTGFGIRWTRYHLKGNHYFEEIDDYTHLLSASDERRFKSSILGITTLNLPLLIEWQNRNGNLFFSAGVECSFKTASSSRIHYINENNKKQKEKVDSGMNLRPVTMDVLVQAGSNDIGVFARYSPISIFEKDKGLELYPLSIGVMLYFR